MLAALRTFSLLGIEAVPVEAEVDVSPGTIPKTILVGLPEAAVRKSTHRVERAIVHGGFQRPYDRVVINLAPAIMPLGKQNLLPGESFSESGIRAAGLASRRVDIRHLPRVKRLQHCIRSDGHKRNAIAVFATGKDPDRSDLPPGDEHFQDTAIDEDPNIGRFVRRDKDVRLLHRPDLHRGRSRVARVDLDDAVVAPIQMIDVTPIAIEPHGRDFLAVLRAEEIQLQQRRILLRELETELHGLAVHIVERPLPGSPAA